MFNNKAKFPTKQRNLMTYGIESNERNETDNISISNDNIATDSNWFGNNFRDC